MANYNLQILVKAVDNATGPLGAASKGVKGLATQAAAAGGILVAFGAICKEVFEFGQEGAQLQRLATAGENLATSMGGSMDDILTSVRRASLGMVADSDIIAGANKAMMLGLGANADQMGNLMEIAAFRARAMGISTTQAFDDIVRGIGRTSPLILDNLGIVLDAKTRYKEYADAVGVSTAELTKQQKIQILLSGVLEEGNTLMAEAGGLAIDNAGAFEQLAASQQNWSDQLKKDVAGPMADFATGLRLILFGGQELVTQFDAATLSVTKTAGTFEEYSSKLTHNAEVMGYQIDAQGNLIRVTGEGEFQVRELIQANYKLTHSQWDAINSSIEFADKLSIQRERLYGTKGATVELTEELLTDAEATDLVTEAFKEAGIGGDILTGILIELGIETDKSGEASARAEQQIIMITDAFISGRINAEQFKEALARIQQGVDKLDFGGGVKEADRLASAINNIPSHKTVTVDMHTRGFEDASGASSTPTPSREPEDGRRRQHGGITRGSTLVGEGGPELAVFPIGTRILPNWYPETQQALGGSTTIVKEYNLHIHTSAPTEPIIATFEMMSVLAGD